MKHNFDGFNEAKNFKGKSANVVQSTLKPKLDTTGAEYSPFSTPNVWLSRAAAAAAASGAPVVTTTTAGAKMNFASVAAANLSNISLAANYPRQNASPTFSQDMQATGERE